MIPPLALYLHIPFCAVRCAYCDFNTYAGLEPLFEPYTAALILEIRRAGAARGRPAVRTVFIGGGTPTVLPSPLLARILAACREAFAIDPDAEITSEANPGTADQACFTALRAMGVNRLSMGVQSFDDAELAWLGRIHSADEAERAFHAARAAGFTNINLDFMFGLPDQEPATWTRTLARAIDLGPEHLSLYSLTVEHGTPLFDRVRRGLAPTPDDDLAAELYELACARLTDGGYEQYEISNWARRITNQRISESANHESRISESRISESANHESAHSLIRHSLIRSFAHSPIRSFAHSPIRPFAHSLIRPFAHSPIRPFAHSLIRSFAHSLIRPFAHSPFAHSPFACRHNLVYWRNEPYLGFGAGSHSSAGARRWWNVRPVPEYIRRIEAGGTPERDGETIDRRLAMGETMMLGLRLVQEGVADARFRERFGVGLEEAFADEIAGLVRRGLLERLPDRVRLTRQGKLLGNQVFAEFL